jgi:tRNA pseudouridine38-40 synthase
MRRAAAHLVGEHDFSAFRSAQCDAAHAIRRLDQIAIDGDDEIVQIAVRGNAFLRNMVRILVGTLVEVGAGRRDPAELPDVLASRDRVRAGITAPPEGLYLVEVFHRDAPRPPRESRE